MTARPFAEILALLMANGAEPESAFNGMTAAEEDEARTTLATMGKRIRENFAFIDEVDNQE